MQTGGDEFVALETWRGHFGELVPLKPSRFLYPSLKGAAQISLNPWMFLMYDNRLCCQHPTMGHVWS